jgi:hypothetical protein
MGCSFCGSERFPIVHVWDDDSSERSTLRECSDCHAYYECERSYRWEIGEFGSAVKS